jgi:hypothetical protein
VLREGITGPCAGSITAVVVTGALSLSGTGTGLGTARQPFSLKVLGPSTKRHQLFAD